MFPIETTRLMIRAYERQDLPEVCELLDSCFGHAPRLIREAWLDWTIRSDAELARLHQPPYGDRAVVLRDDNTLIGSVGIVPSYGPFEKLPFFQSRLQEPNQAWNTPEIGLFWAIHPEHRRRGYASEAAGALAGAVFTHLHAARLVASTEHENLASIAVMRRIGMRIERNPDPDPPWFQTVGILPRPELAAH